MLKARPTDRPPVNKNASDTVKAKKKNYIFNFAGNLIKKNILKMFIALFVMVFVIVILTPFFVNLRVWKPEIVAMLEDLTNKQASIDGDISLNIFPVPEVTIEDIKLIDIDVDQNSSQDFLSLEKIRAKVTIWPLFKGKIVIEKVELDGFELILQDRKDGTPNWISNRETNTPTEGESNNENLMDSNLKSKNVKNSSNISFADIEIKEYEFSKGLVVLKNNAISFKLGIEELSIIPKDSVNNIVVGILNLYDQDVSLKSNFINSNEDKSFWNGLISLKHDDLVLNLNLKKINFKSYPSLEGDFNLNSDNLKKFFDGIKVDTIKGLKLELPAKSTGKLNLFFNKDNLIYKIEDLSVSLGSTIFNGSINGVSGLKPIVDIDFSSNSIDLDEGRSDLSEYLISLSQVKKEKSKGNKASDKNSYWEKLSGSLFVSIGTTKLFDYPIRDIAFNLKKDSEDFKVNNFSAVFPGNTKINLNGHFGSEFDVFEGNMKFDTQDFRSYAQWSSLKNINFFPEDRFRAVDFYSDLVIRPGAATFAGIKGKFDTSSFLGEIRFRWGDNRTLSTSLHLDKINLDFYKPGEEVNNLDSSISNTDTSNKKKELNFRKFLNNDTKMNLNISIDEAILYGKKILGFKYSGSINKDIINIEDLSINYFDGLKILGSGGVNISRSVPEFDMKLQINSESSNVANFYNLSDKVNTIFSNNFYCDITFKGNQASLDTVIDAGISDLKLDYTGNINLNNFFKPVFKGDISFGHNSIGKFLTEDFGIKDSSFKGIGTFKSRIYSNQDSLELKDIVFTSENIEYRGNTKITHDDNQINFQSNLKGNFITMSNILSFIDYFSLSKFLTEKNYDDSDFNINGTLKLDLDEFEFYGLNLNSVKIYSRFERNNILVNRFNGEIYDGSVSFNSSIIKEPVSKLLAQGVHIPTLESTFWSVEEAKNSKEYNELQQVGMDMTLIDSEIAEQFKTHEELQRDNSDFINFQSNLSLSGVNLSSLNKDIFGWEFLNGRVFSDLEIKSKTKDINKLIKSFYGKGKIEARDIRIINFNPNVISNISQNDNSKTIDQIIRNSYSNGTSSIKNFSNNIIIIDSKIVFDKLSLNFEDITGDLSGNIDFINKNSEMVLNFNMKDKVGVDVGLVYDGNWDKMKRSIIINRVFEEDITKDQVIVKGDEVLLEKDLGNLIDNITQETKDTETNKFKVGLYRLNKEAINENNQIVEPEIEQDDFDTTIKLPKLLAIKTILKPSYSEYNNITPIENETIKPKKPSQEELLDDVLESILE